MMIQISDSTKRLLDMFGNFFTEERGTIKIKVSTDTIRKYSFQKTKFYNVLRWKLTL